MVFTYFGMGWLVSLTGLKCGILRSMLVQTEVCWFISHRYTWNTKIKLIKKHKGYIPLSCTNNYLPWIISLDIVQTGIIVLHAYKLYKYCKLQLCKVSSVSVHLFRRSCAYETYEQTADRVIPIYLQNLVCRVYNEQPFTCTANILHSLL